MSTEKGKTLGALQTAIQMEIDGKKFYLKAGQASKNELGKELLKKLAAEEDIHQQVFERIYNDIRSQKAWPKTDFEPDGGRGLRTIFARSLEEMDPAVNTASTELDAVQTAMAMENKTYDFYKDRSKKATHTAEKEFYEAIAAQESEHHRVLLDYFEFLKDPASWFVQKEHPSLDGG